MGTKIERRELLEKSFPEGVAVSRMWLNELDLSNHAIDNLVKSKYLKPIQRGIYVRGYAKLSWQSVVYTLQYILKKDFIVGGLSALELQGFSHYIPFSEQKEIHLYGDDILPNWVNKVSDTFQFIRYPSKELFHWQDRAIIQKSVTDFAWKNEMQDIKIASPEMAILQVLQQVPEKISFEHALQLIQGMTTLSPRKLQELLEVCHHIKVKRLFMYLADLQHYSWFEKLNKETIYLGKGVRMLVKGGVVDKTYMISIPKEMYELTKKSKNIMKAAVLKQVEPKFSYFWLRLKEYLNESYPELANDQDFLDARDELASQTFVDCIKNGDNLIEAEHYANEVLFANLPFSKMDMIFDVVCEEFNRHIEDDKLREFAEKMFPICEPVFEKYDIEKRDFEDTKEYQLLYTELTGTIVIWLEENSAK